jgi:hypothetical protein
MNLILLTVFLFHAPNILSVSDDASAGSSDQRVQAIYEDLEFFVWAGVISDDNMRLFFAREAADAGVSAVRPMTESEKPEIAHQTQTGCGKALIETSEIIIDVDQSRCINLSNLAHEIAHIPTYRTGCSGHNDTFYQINAEIARRFEDAFPGEPWGSGSPVERVRKRSREYRTPC